MAQYTCHDSLTEDRIVDAVEADEYIGFCLDCGNEQSGCEPDMRGGQCEVCGYSAVFGAEECLLMGVSLGATVKTD